MTKKYSKKMIKKLFDGKCYFCEEDDYDLLDTHRIVPGSEGGRYTRHNSVTVCCKCHRKIHSDKIKIVGKHFSTSGQHVLNFIDENDVERWK